LVLPDGRAIFLDAAVRSGYSRHVDFQLAGADFSRLHLDRKSPVRLRGAFSVNYATLSDWSVNNLPTP
jgi:hypothetical protein